MRSLFIGISCLALAACSQSQRADRSESAESSESAPPPAMRMEPADTRDAIAGSAAPGIVPTAAPGVAFNYKYAFRLPAARIAEVQEANAAACEKLGIAHCRITGMHYQLVRENEISGMLAFKLDPALARQFGKDGIAAVAKAEGMLVESEISGVDAGAAIASADREAARIATERAAIEARLKQPGITADERARIEDELAQLRAALERTRTTKTDSVESLATTPMVFTYGSGDLVPGFDARTPLHDALSTAGATIVGTVAVVIVIAGALLPWALLLLIAWFAWRAVRPRIAGWRSKPAKSPDADA